MNSDPNAIAAVYTVTSTGGYRRYRSTDSGSTNSCLAIRAARLECVTTECATDWAVDIRLSWLSSTSRGVANGFDLFSVSGRAKQSSMNVTPP